MSSVDSIGAEVSQLAHKIKTIVADMEQTAFTPRLSSVHVQRWAIRKSRINPDLMGQNDEHEGRRSKIP